MRWPAVVSILSIALRITIPCTKQRLDHGCRTGGRSSAFCFPSILFERIGSGEVFDYLTGKSKRGDFEELLGKLKIVLNSVSAVLDVAEQKQIKSRRVETWLDELQEAVFDAEDLLDRIESHAFQLKSGSKSSTATSKVRKSKKEKMQNLFSMSRNSNSGRNMERKMKRILERLENIAKQMDFLGLKEGIGVRPSHRLPSTSLVEQSGVYGRNGDRDTIINLLLSDDEGGDKIGEIAIVGMGGIGKTTLAQLVYNNDDVNRCFELKAWVCVTGEFDVCRVTKTVVESVTSVSCDVSDLNALQVKLRDRLKGNKFLIVLDDMWCENYTDWEMMVRPFVDGAEGSKIIVTTRSEKVTRIMKSVRILRLEKLGFEDCLLLFSKHALGSGDFADCPDLEVIGRKIVMKCKGLPLAVKALGVLLHSTVDVGDWERVLNSEIWDLAEESDILPALRLSYYYLPSYLKRCFAYCSMFPKNFEFEKDQMISLWMAENLLEKPGRNKRIEDVGEAYFNDLLSRSFFQRASTHSSFSLWFTKFDPLYDTKEATNKGVFVMHDLMHDLAKFVAREYFVELKDGSRGEINVSKVRHLAYVMETNDPYRRFNHVLEATHLRTFLPVRLDGFEGNKNISAKIVDDLLMKLRCLRVLSFSGYLNVQQLPDSIGELTHLRYLDLSYTSISLLPESTSMLFNLQTLKLNYCQRLKKLPRDLHNLLNLRYLDVRSCINLAEMPPRLGELKSLQMLSTFIVGKDSGTKLGELREFSDLRGELHISKLENVADANDALDQANLMDKKHLEKLTLGWSYHSKDDSTNTMDVLEMLLPNRTLKKLEIYEYPGTGFPKWLGSDSVSNIVFLRLSQCRNCSSLPPLGQLPSLKTLDISGLDAIVTVGPEFCGNDSVPTPFPSLEILKFNSMSSWQQWISVQAGNSGTFAKLRELYISDCDKLTRDLPCTLPSLTKLRINCKQFASPIPKIPSVRVLEFGGCENQLQVSSFFEALKQVETCPLHLRISNCSSSVSVGCLPSNLETLDIYKCKKLDFPFFQPLKSLEVLNLHGSFDSLKSFPLDSFPKLKELYIRNSESLESFSVSDGQQQDLTALSTLIMSNCPSFAFFPDGGLPAPNLTFLSVGNCKKLKSLPKKMHSLLPSLEFLAIRYCPEIESFPEAGLPLNLRNLGIEGCDKLIASRLSWDLQRLPNLTSFTIHGTSRYEGAESVRTMRRRIRSYEGVESFPEEGLLPTTITSLSIGGFPNLKVLDRNGLQKLTSLRELRVSVCIELQITPERLPTSLKYFSISECPLLKKRCCKKNKEYWSEIDRIFCVKIGDEIVS